MDRLPIAYSPIQHSVHFFNGIVGYLRSLEPDRLIEIPEDNARLLIWAEAFKLHYLARRQGVTIRDAYFGELNHGFTTLFFDLQLC